VTIELDEFNDTKFLFLTSILTEGFRYSDKCMPTVKIRPDTPLRDVRPDAESALIDGSYTEIACLAVLYD